MINLINKFETLKSASFIGINNYTNSEGEISNFLINTNISVQNAKEKDLETLKNLSQTDLYNIHKNNQNIDFSTFQIALTELICNAEKNLIPEQRNNSSIGQSESYIHITRAIKIHKEKLHIYVTGFKMSQTILKPIVKKSINSKPLTIAKNLIKNYCNLRMNNFYIFNVGNAEKITVNGNILYIQ